MEDRVAGVIAAATPQGRGGTLVVHPRGARRPRWTLPWTAFAGAPAPKAGMLVEIVFAGGRVRQVIRSSAAQDPALVRENLLGSLRGLARTMAAQVHKAGEMGWEIPAAYTEAVALLEAAGETAGATADAAGDPPGP